MTIDFYLNNDEKNKINKTLVNAFTVENVFFKNGINTSNPFLKLSNFNYNLYNYCYIRELNKYYFFDSVDIENSNIIRINLKIDVLMSYKNIIKETRLNIIECDKEFINVEKATADKKDNLILSKIDIDIENLFNNDKIIMVVRK